MVFDNDFIDQDMADIIEAKTPNRLNGFIKRKIRVKTEESVKELS